MAEPKPPGNAYEVRFRGDLTDQFNALPPWTFWGTTPTGWPRWITSVGYRPQEDVTVVMTRPAEVRYVEERIAVWAQLAADIRAEHEKQGGVR